MGGGLTASEFPLGLGSVLLVVSEVGGAFVTVRLDVHGETGDGPHIQPALGNADVRTTSSDNASFAVRLINFPGSTVVHAGFKGKPGSGIGSGSKIISTDDTFEVDFLGFITCFRKSELFNSGDNLVALFL